jgi:Arc/MetJ family transcription regulator
MDHIIEHEGQPVPELSVVNESTSSRVPMDVDDDEDAEALRSLGVVTGNEVEAKVHLFFQTISPA